MRETGFRLDLSKLDKRMAEARAKVRPEAFRPLLKKWLKASLGTAVKTTPIRNLSIIKQNQAIQYDHRINYIPSYHELRDPTLIVKPDGLFLFCNGKWWKPDLWHLPPDVYASYQSLLSEHLRRMDTAKAEFIAHRAQARFLWALTWVQVGESVGVDVFASKSVKNSATRREPPKNPARGYAQERGSKTILSIVIYNPFIEEDGPYNDRDGAQIIKSAAAKHKPAFIKNLKNQVDRVLYAIFAAG